MTVELRWGGASDVGRLRSVNQDSILLSEHVCAVADGMGGHAAGEVASQITIETLTAELRDPPLRVLDLVAAVQAANDAVLDRALHEPETAGMGTTIVAVAPVVEAGETRISIVNVGDSRAYRLTADGFDQISDDHSLVGELLRSGQITKAEARNHPRKNIVNRAIGTADYVDVDEFQILPRRGDRYLLCSDGLTDEVTDAEIEGVLRRVDDPDAAARQLVELANEHGGHDNISVVIVDVVEDGLTDAARAALPDDVDFSHDPDQDTAGIDPVPHSVGAPRVVTVRSLAYVCTILVLVGAGGFLAYKYVRDTFHVGVHDGEVTVFRGRPGGVLWFDPSVVEGTDIAVDDVPEDVLDDLEDGVSQPSLRRAREYVDRLEDRIADLTPPVEAPRNTRPPNQPARAR